MVERWRLAGRAVAGEAGTTADFSSANAGALPPLTGDKTVGLAARDVFNDGALGSGSGSCDGNGGEDAEDDGGELHFGKSLLLSCCSIARMLDLCHTARKRKE